MESKNVQSTPKNDNTLSVAAVVLAGGAATRMQGADKGLVSFKDQTLVEAVIDRIRPQVDELVISANRNIETYRKLGYPVVTDAISGYPGPLTGIAAALDVIKSDYLVTVPCDSPYVPTDLVEKLSEAFFTNPSLKCASVISQGLKQPIFMMIKKEMRTSIEAFLGKGERKVRAWLESEGVAWVEFDDLSAFDNFNTLEELQKSAFGNRK